MYLRQIFSYHNKPYINGDLIYSALLRWFVHLWSRVTLLLQSSVFYDSLEIILIWWFSAQKAFSIINVSILHQIDIFYKSQFPKIDPDDWFCGPGSHIVNTVIIIASFNVLVVILILIAVSFHSTWTGPAWSPAQSISSVLISIQSLMTENPYHNEPGFEQVLPLPQCILKVIAHWVRNVRTLKNKYDLTLCQSRLHIASEIFVCHKNLDRVRFFFFFALFASVASILRGVLTVKFIHFISHTKHCI